MNIREEAVDVLRRVGNQSDDKIDLGEAALALSVLRHNKKGVSSYRRHLEQMIKQTIGLLHEHAITVENRINLLRHTMVVRNRYSEDDNKYDDFRNLDLIGVIDNRKGMPIALGLLYLHLAHSAGWGASGLDVPGGSRFLIKLEDENECTVIDPFLGGKICEPDELAEFFSSSFPHAHETDDGDETEDGEDDENNDNSTPIVTSSNSEAVQECGRPHGQVIAIKEMGNRDVLLRLQEIVKLSQAQAQHYDAALSTVQTMLLIAPMRDDLWLETGLLQTELGHMRAAVNSFNTSRELSRGSGKIGDLSETMLQRLRRQIN